MSTKIAPKSQLKLEWVYGYRGHETRNNLYYTANKDAVYFVAAVGIVYNLHDKRQKFYLGHDDDIVSLTLHPEKVLVASGQIGKNPYICVWDSNNVETVSLLKDGHKQGVAALNFDKVDGSKLVSVGLDQHSTINVWDWQKGKIMATVRGHSDRVLDVSFMSKNSINSVVSCGVKHIKFWTIAGNTLTAKKGVFGKVGEIQTILCLTFDIDGTTTYSGTLSGDIYVWKGNNLDRVISRAHKGATFAINASIDGYVSGGKDGQLIIWDKDFKSINASINIGSQLIIRSVYWSAESVLVGTQDSRIYEINLMDKRPKLLMIGHAEGELWGLAVHPSKKIFATGSDDQTLKIWNIDTKELINQKLVQKPIRSCSFNEDASHIAIGLINGSFMVLRSKDLEEVITIKDRQEVIHEMKYSPDGTFLAVGSNDNFVDIYLASQRYKKVGQCSGSSSFITHLDWSKDSKFIQTNSGAAEQLFFRMPTGKQVTNSDEIRAIHWFSWTGVLGAEVNGIWEKYTDTNDVNATDANFTDSCLVTGDDFGLVKLFRFPALKKGAKFRKYVGHSAHVTNCRFIADKSCVLTTGGGDHAIFQWKFLSEADDGTKSVVGNTYVDSNSEDSDSDLSDVGEIDSEIESERHEKNYDRIITKEDEALLRREMMKKELQAGQKRAMPPTDAIKLKFVYGYRGYDCRNNVFYLQNGEIVYHVAAVGIVYNRETHSQRFYIGHSDDILCLAIHPMKGMLVATGQVGKDATVHIWSAVDLNSVSILKGGHERAVCAVDFSSNGRNLVSIGMDDDHTIVIWDWKKGEKLAWARGHKDKIFSVKFNSSDNDQLITVGIKHIKFWTRAGSGLTSVRGVFGKIAKLDTITCLAYGTNPGVVYTGGANGLIYIWNDTKLISTVKAHQGAIQSMHGLDKGFVTGGKDGTIMLWDEKFERSLKTYSLKRSCLATGSPGTFVEELPSVRAIVLGHGRLIAGTKNGELVEIDKEGNMQILVQGHGQGELWGLAVHSKALYAASISLDKTVRLWDLKANRMVNCRCLKKGGRAIAFSPDGKAIAIGFEDGSFSVINSDSLQDIAEFHHRKQSISDIRFSPEPGRYLAVGSHDNYVDIYDVITSKRTGVCKGASSYITHIDWDNNGKLLMVNTGAKEQLFFEAPRGKRQTLRHAEIMKVNWDSWTCVIGDACIGIWPAGCDVTDVNASCLSKSKEKQILATGDDFGFVKLFQFPVTGKFAKYKKYSGHSAHVTNVRWTFQNEFLLSAGGADTSIMVWESSANNNTINGNLGNLEVSGNSNIVDDLDDDDDDNDDDEECYDSDVAREKNIDYSTKTYTDSIRLGREKIIINKEDDDDSEDNEDGGVTRRTKNKTRVASVTAKSNINDLQLTHIFGYRGWDTRNNLFYTGDDDFVVYHAAAAGIVHNTTSGKQTFYTKHTDDIISLTINHHPKFKNVIATGQIGKEPEINIWNSSNLTTLSVLRGQHKIGVCSLSFSASGKLLASVGLDDKTRIVIYRWQDGCQVASVGGNKRIFVCAFRPDSDSAFVTVGVKHLKFWTIAGAQLIGKNPILNDKAKMQTMLSVAFGSDNATFTGAMNGDIYVWCLSQLQRVVVKAHSGPIFSLFTTLKDGLIVSGAKELITTTTKGAPVKLWDQEMRKNRPFLLPVDSSNKSSIVVVKSVCRQKGRILVGTADSQFIELNEKSAQYRCLPCGHAEGELWGLAVHPTSHKFLTASDDGTFRFWDIGTHDQLAKFNLGPARSTHITGDGKYIVVGLKNGGFVLIDGQSLKILLEKRDRGQPINDIRFSPDNQLLAVCSHDGFVDIYKVDIDNFSKVSYCQINSAIYIIDFSSDSKFIRTTSVPSSIGQYVNRIFDTKTGKEVRNGEDKDIIWATWKTVIGDQVQGIWPKDASKNSSYINCAHVSHSGNNIVTGDDQGLVKLFKFPSLKKYASYKSYAGHSAHVTNVWFTFDDYYLISTGGDDSSVFVWKCLKKT